MNINRFNISILLFIFLISTGPGCQSRHTETEGLNALHIVETYPADLSENIPVESAIRITFSEDVYAVERYEDSNIDFDGKTIQITGADMSADVAISGSVVTISPSSLLPYAIQNTGEETSGCLEITIKRGLFRSVSKDVTMTEDYTFSFCTEPPPAQEIIRTVPATGATGVSVNTSFTVELKEPVDMSSLSVGTYEMNGISLTITDISETMISFKPENSLPYNYHFEYTFFKGDALTRSTAGGTLDADFIWQFDTEKTIAPEVVGTDPENGAEGVPVDTCFSVTFSEPIDTSLLTPGKNTFVLNGQEVELDLSFTETAITITSDTPLEYGTEYSFTLPASYVVSQKGEKMADDYTLSFTTVSATPPTVVSSYPANGSNGVSVNTSFTLVFSEAIDTSFLTQGEQTFMFNGLDITVELSFTDYSITLDPVAELGYGKTYSLTVPAKYVRSKAGAYMKNDYVWTFTTEKAPSADQAYIEVTDAYTDMAYTADNRYVLGLGSGKFLDVIDVENKEISETIPIGNIFVGMMPVSYGTPTAMDADLTNNKLYIVTNVTGTVIVFDLDTFTFEEIAILYKIAAAWAINGLDVKVAPELNRMYILSETVSLLFRTSYQLTILSIDTGEVLAREDLDGEPVSMALSGSTKTLYILYAEDDGSRLVKYSVAGNRLTELDDLALTEMTGNFALSPDGKTIALSTGKKVVFYAETFSVLTEWQPSLFSSLYKVFGPDSDTLYVTTADNRMSGYDISERTEILSGGLPNAERFSLLTTNSDGSVVAAFSYDTDSEDSHRVYFFDKEE